jgi:transposase
VGLTPIVHTTGARFSWNMISAASPRAELRLMVVRGTVTAARFIEFLQRLLRGSRGPIFLVVNGHPTHRAKLVQRFVESTAGRLRLFFLPAYAPELTPDELVWRHVKAHNGGRRRVTRLADLKAKIHQALRHLQRSPATLRGLFNAPTLRYARL